MTTFWTLRIFAGILICETIILKGSHAFVPSSIFTSGRVEQNLPTKSSLSESWSIKDPDIFSKQVGSILLSDVVAVDGEASAFTDSINYLDGTISTMLGVFGVVLVVLIGFKALTDQMDSAIEQVLVDFETTMKRQYPQRWQSDIRPALEGLQGEERQQKLVQIMEDLERNDPTFMSRVQGKMKGI